VNSTGAGAHGGAYWDQKPTAQGPPGKPGPYMGWTFLYRRFSFDPEAPGRRSGDPLRCPFMLPIWARRRNTRGGWLLFVVLLTACGPSTVAPSSATASGTPSHFEFDAKVTVGPIEPWVTTMPIYVSFLSNHVAVQPTGSDSVRCNGVALRGQPSDVLGYHYEGKVARVQVGGVYECVYTREGVR